MNESPSNLNDWEPCGEGLLVEAVDRLKAQRRDRMAARAVGVAGTLVILLFVGAIGFQQYQKGADNHHGGISCAKVKTSLEAYVAGKLTPELEEQIEIHLAKCPKCQELRDQMMGEEGVATVRADEHHWSCPCDECRPQVAFAP